MAHIATVASITGTGTVYAVNALGVQRIVKAGDVLEKGETLRTVGDATVELLMDDGNLMAIAPDKTVHLDDNVSQSDTLPTAADSAISSSATSETIIQALERGTDLSTTLDATAAGLDGGGGGGNSFVQLLRISEGVDAQSYNFNFSGLGVLPIPEGAGVVTPAGDTGNPIPQPTIALVSDSTDGVAGHASDGITNNANLNISAPAVGSTRVITVDGQVVNSYDPAGLKDGVHTVNVTDTDAAGNTKSAEVNFTLDTTIKQPTITLVSDSTDGVAGHASDAITNNADLKISAPEAGSTRVITVDGQVVNSYDPAGLKDGAHTVNVTDTDVAGNTKSAEVNFTLDTTIAQPTIALVSDTGVSATDHITADGQLAFGDAAEKVTREYSLDGGQTWTSSYTAPTVDGDYTVTVRDTDVAGNSNSASLSFTLDTHAAASISINPVGNDVVTVAQAAAGGTLTVTGTVGGDAKVHDFVTLTVNGHDTRAEVEEGPHGLIFSAQVAVADLVADKRINAKIIVTDVAGSSFTAEAHHTITGESVARDDGRTVTEDRQVSDGLLTTNGAVTVDSSSGLANAVDPASTNLVTHTYVSNGITQDTPALGKLIVHADGTYDFNVSNADVQFLGQGDKIVQTYEVKSADGTATSTINITINGTNDVPTFGTGTGHDAGGVTEDATTPKLSTTGTLVVSDADQGQSGIDTTVAPVASAGALGSISIDKQGNWTYNVDNSKVQYLGADEYKVETFTVKSLDGTSHDITVTITGTNDAPVVSAALTATAAEGEASFSKNLLAGASDVDSGETATLSVTSVKYAVDGGAASTSAPAGVSLSGSTLTVDPKNAAFDHLAEGQHETIVVSYNVTDVHGATVAQTETVTITGTNDAPVVSAALTATAAEGEASFSKNLLAGASDVDSGETATLSVTSVKYAVDGGAASTSAPAGVSLSGSTLTVDPKNAAFDHLAEGQHETIVVSYNVTDVHGATVAQTETVTITGTNDAPVVSAALTATAAEGEASFSKNLLAGASDVDSGETATLSVTSVKYAVDGGAASTSAPAGVSLSGSTLTVDPKNAAFDHLAEGQHETIVVSYNVTDVHGATVAQTETVTITGTNDAPVVSAALTATAAEGEASFSKNLLAGASDVDSGETATLSVTSVKYAVDGGAASTSAPAGVSLSGSTLTVDPKNAAFDHLAEGQHETIVVSYNVTDVHGATVAQTETVTITGTNDAPVVSAALTATAAEGEASFSKNLLAGASDVDSGETATLSVTSVKYAVDGGAASTSAPAGVSLSGSTLTVDPKNAAFDHLAEGQHETIVVSYNVTDVHGATVAQTETVTITGTNDAPVVSAALTATAAEGEASFSKNLLAGASDVDSGETATLSVTSVKYAVDGGAASTSAPAGVSLSGSTLTVDPKNAAFDHLAEGQHETIVVSYNVTDVHGATVAQTETVTITGTNDAPVVSAALTATAAEGEASFSKNLLAGASDVDSGETATLSVTSVKYAVDGGAASTSAPAGVSLSGSTLTVDPKNAAFDHLAEGQHETIVVSYNVTDVHGATVAQTETVTITGTNDAPVIHATENLGSVYEAGLDNGSHTGPTTKSVSGTFEVSDVDSAKFEVTAAGALHGVVVLTPGSTPGAWSWTYTLTSNIDNDATGVNVEPGKDSFTLTVSDGNKSSSTVVNVSVIDDVPVAHVTSPGYLQYGESEHDKDVQDARDAQRKDQEDDGNHVSDAKSKLHEQESNRDAHDEQGSKRIADAEKSLKDAKEHYGSNSEKAHEAQGELDRAKNDQAKQHDLDEKSVKAANDELTAALNTQHQHEVDDEKRVQDGVDNAHLNTFSGTLASLGADAVGAHVTWDKPADVSLGDDRTLTYMLNPEKTLLQAFEQDQHGTSKLAFALAAHDDGTYLFTQYQTLDTKVNLSFGFTATDGDKDSVHVSAGSANSLQLATQNTMIGNHSEDGHEVGSSNNDFIKVGVGSHLLEGKEGADVFKWSLSEHDGSKLSIDHIKDFDVTTKGDTLDLRDLLHGSLDSDHLQFGKVGDKLALLVSHDGHLDSTGDGADVKIVLDNRDGSNVEAAKVTLAHELDSSFNGHSISDHDLLKKLVDTGHLKTDV